MKKKSQIRKYTVDKVEELTEGEQIPEMLKLYAEHVGDKRTKLIEKRDDLQAELASIRKRSAKIVEQMVDNVQDRLDKKERVIMDAGSRPTHEDIKAMTDLFTYMQNQGRLISVNGEKMGQLQQFLKQVDEQATIPTFQYDALDISFSKLQAKCEQEQQQRDRLNNEMEANQKFYSNIKNTIEECRVKYERVEKQIAEREKELDHLVTYFQTRQREDKEKIDYENKMTTMLETQLLKAQQIFNYNSRKDEGLRIAQTEFEPNAP